MPIAVNPASDVTTEGKLGVKVQVIQTSSTRPVFVQARAFVVDRFGAMIAKGITNAPGIFETKLAAGSYKLPVRADALNDTSLRVDIASGISGDEWPLSLSFSV